MCGLVMELVDMQDLGSCASRCKSSSLFRPTKIFCNYSFVYIKESLQHMSLTLPIKRLRNVPLPRYGREGDAALDLCSGLEAPLVLAPNERADIPTGVAMAIPAGHVGLIFPRSGLGSQGFNLRNSTGVIDSNYRGELVVRIINNGPAPLTINPNDRIVQMAIMPVATCAPTEVEDLDATNRNAAGFGSSGA